MRINIQLILVALCITFLSTPLYAKNDLPKLFLRQITYKGDLKIDTAAINGVILDEVAGHSLVEIIDAEKDADYILSGLFEATIQGYTLTMEIAGITTNRIKDSVTKKAASKEWINLIISEAVEYLYVSAFPVQMYQNGNAPFLAQNKLDAAQNGDDIDRGRKFIKRREDYLFAPVQENYFKKHLFQIQLTGSGTFPVNIMQNDVSPSFNATVPFHFYFFSTELITLSLFTEGNYNLFFKKVGLNKYNYLHIIGIGGGVGVSLSLPSFRQISFDLNLGGGYALSCFLSDQMVGTLQFTGDPYIYPVLECVYDITEQISLSLNCSYLWVIYTGENMHSVQAGLGIGYRF